MGCLVGLRGIILLIAAVNIVAQKKPLTNISSKCLGNIMRVDVGPLNGKLLEVAVVMNNSAILLTPALATQCGFSLKIDQLGNAMIYASLHNCFAHNVKDEAFTTTLNLRLSGSQMFEDELYQVAETCYYTAWASREIVCQHNYMEVSVKKANPHDYDGPKYPFPLVNSKFGDPRRFTEPIEEGFMIKALVFSTPERTMMVQDALRNGYGIANTPSRVVLRSPKKTPQICLQNVAGVAMTALKTSVILEKKWLATRINVVAACPLLEGSVFFTLSTITWYLPWHIRPLISSHKFKLLEVHMGINGQRLTAAETAAKRYSLSIEDKYVVVRIPVGAVGGYFKSHVQYNQYFTTYMIEPMVELLWTEGDTHQDTRYKVLFPITTPLMSQPLQIIDKTVPEDRIFKVLLGPFASDVALMNISFPSEVLSMADCSARGISVQEHMSPNSSSKVFMLEVPFTDPVVQRVRKMGVTVYGLQMTFGLLVLPEFATFSQMAYVEAKLVNTGSPSVSGGCDHLNFYVLIKYGIQDFTFETIMGKQTLTPALAQQYSFVDNGTHFSFIVPFSSSNVVYEAVEPSSIRSRLDVVLRNPATKINIQEYSVTCNFNSPLTECFPNGTMTALALKLESVPSLNTSRLTLKDPTCGPSISSDRFAYFQFTGNSCGTTRKFLSDVMLYENEISLPNAPKVKQHSDTTEPLYQLKISCSYDVNTTQALAFFTKPLLNKPYAENAKGELEVAMRLALDDSYSAFYKAENYPLAMHLNQPMYFEVELMGSRNPEMSLELENCWVTLNKDRLSKPRWSLITDGCMNPQDQYKMIFHFVRADARVQYPSHFKRFEVQKFAFTKDQNVCLNCQLFIHCDVVICDARNPLGRVCNRRCPNKQNVGKGKRDVSHTQRLKHVSLGPILTNLK